MSRDQAESPAPQVEHAPQADHTPGAQVSQSRLGSLSYWQAQLVALGMTALVVICCVLAFSVFVVR